MVTNGWRKSGLILHLIIVLLLCVILNNQYPCYNYAVNVARVVYIFISTINVSVIVILLLTLQLIGSSRLCAALRYLRIRLYNCANVLLQTALLLQQTAVKMEGLTQVFVTGLPYNTLPADLEHIFRRYNSLARCDVRNGLLYLAFEYSIHFRRRLQLRVLVVWLSTRCIGMEIFK